MSQSFEILVVGGGVVGLTAALAMAQQQFTVAVLDASSLTVDGDKLDSRVFAINKASQRLLEKLKAWSHIPPLRLSPYQQMHVWDVVSGAAIDFDSREIATAYLGNIIEESILKYALLQQIALESRIHLFPNSSINEVKHLQQSIQVSNQEQSWEGQLLMIADGVHSPMREILKVKTTHWSYQQQALVATVSTELSHQKTAYQVFTPEGPLAFLPLTHPNHCSIVWSCDGELAKERVSLDASQFNEQLTQAFEQTLGQVTLQSKRRYFPLHMNHVQQYSGHRWILLGDAAHSIHPLAGLGLNLGLADLATWIRCLDKKNLVSSQALGQYQRERKFVVWQNILLMEGFKRLFGHAIPPITHLRGLGLRVCNHLAPLKRLCIQHAVGEES